MLRCDRCERTAPREIVVCPHHADHSCAFLVQGQAPVARFSLPWRAIIGVIVLGPILSLILALLTGEIALLWIGTLVSSEAGVMAAVARTRRCPLLYNPATGQMWRATCCLGIRWRQVEVRQVEPLDLAEYPRAPLPTPASLAAYASGQGLSLEPPLEIDLPPDLPPDLTVLAPGHDRAAYTFFAALIGLLADGVIAVRVAATCRRYLGGLLGSRKRTRPVYLFVPGPNAHCQPAGRLEARILATLQDWSAQPAARQWPQGAPAYDLARAVFPFKAEYSAAVQLAELMAEEAAASSLNRLPTDGADLPDGGAGADRAAIPPEADPIRAAYERLAQDAPTFHQQVRKGLKRAF